MLAKIKFIVPNILANITGGNREIPMDVSNIREAINSLVSQYGEEFERRVLEPTGEPRRLLNFYVNGKNIRFLSNLETDLNEGDEVMLLPAVGGG